MANTKLTNARKAKNDEFYTQLSDIEKEMSYYKKHFYGKKIFLNCDDPETSYFWQYFAAFFDEYQLEKLTSTHYHPTEPTYKLEIVRGKDINGDGKMDGKDLVKTPLLGNGDFRSAECIELLDEADIVITNPPFSLFREYIALLVEHNKKFITIGNLNAITYKEIFPLLQQNKLWFGATCFKGGAAYFIAPQELYEPEKMSNPKHAYMENGVFYWRVNGVRWYTNLDIDKRHDKLPLWKDYEGNETDYPEYDNYAAIEVGKVAEIPCDYFGVMGVPVSFMDKYCPEQFRIIGADFDLAGPVIVDGKEKPNPQRLYVDGRRLYSRILIQRIEQPENQDTEEE